MANVYAVKSGNWSDTTVWNTGTLPTSADDVFANGFTVTVDQNVNVLSLRNSAATGITAGGTFSVSGSFTITSINSLVRGAATAVITCNSTSTINLNVSIINQSEPSSFGTYISISNSGSVNIVGNITNWNNTGSRTAISKGGTGKLSFTGDITCSLVLNSVAIQVDSGDVDITGSLTMLSSNSGTSSFTNNHILNYSGTGNVVITGNLVNNAVRVNGSGSTSCVNSTAACYIKHIGTMNSTNALGGWCISNANINAINIFTGPFICSATGVMPFFVTRMHYQKTLGSYFEFRDSSTNGALPPSAPAPATRLVSPDTVVDAPIPSDVRDGVSYALNTFTGTLKVPSTASVAFGVPVDNTTGVALLTGDSWIAAISSSNDPFAERLKNVATVQTTAAQIAAF